MEIFEVYSPGASETLARFATLAEAKAYVESGLVTWVENVPGEWWAMFPTVGTAQYVIFTETVD